MRYILFFIIGAIACLASNLLNLFRDLYIVLIPVYFVLLIVLIERFEKSKKLKTTYFLGYLCGQIFVVFLTVLTSVEIVIFIMLGLSFLLLKFDRKLVVPLILIAFGNFLYVFTYRAYWGFYENTIEYKDNSISLAEWHTRTIPVRPTSLTTKDNRRLLFFYNSKCTYCIPMLNSLKKVIPSERLVLIDDGIYDNVEETKLTKEFGISNSPVYLDSNSVIYNQLKLQGVPSWVILDENAKVVYLQDGKISRSRWLLPILEKRLLLELWGEDAFPKN